MLVKELKENFRQLLLRVYGRLCAFTAAPNTVRAAALAAKLLLGALLSQARLFGAYAPFGTAICSVFAAGTDAFACLVGAAIGYAIGNPFTSALKYISVCVLIFVSKTVFRDTRIAEKPYFFPLVSAFMTAVTGIVYVANSGWRILGVSFYIMETVLTGSAAYFFALSQSQEEGERKTVSVLVLLAAVMTALSRVKLAGAISVGRLAAEVFVICAAYGGGMGMGAALGTSLGAAMDAACGGVPFYSLAYALSGLIAGAGRKAGKIFFMLTFLAVNAAVVVCTLESTGNAFMLYEVFAALVIFCLLPEGLLVGKLRALKGREINVKEYTLRRIKSAAEAFDDLYRTVKDSCEAGKNDGDVSTVFDCAAEKICRRCGKMRQCWQRDYISTVDALNNVSEKMIKAGKLQETDFPHYFSDSCLDIKGFTQAINEELKAYMFRRQYKNRLRENQTAMYGQYHDVAEILSEAAAEMDSEIMRVGALEKKLQRQVAELGLSAAVFKGRSGRLHAEIMGDGAERITQKEGWLDELSALLETRLCSTGVSEGRLVLLEAEPLAVTVGIASVHKKGESANGDKGSYFKTDDGTLYLILSDGMGSGRAAERGSDDAIRILERFLRAGVKPDAALRILNSVLLVKSENELVCTAIDLLSVNLFTGKSCFFKYGAAPSYVKQGERVLSIKGQSFAAGAAEGMPDMKEAVLSPESFALVLSDGVVQGEDGWLKETIASYGGRDAKTLARMTVEEALRHNGSEDDMTAICIFIERRK